MKVRELIRRLTELARDDAEVGIITFEGNGSVTIRPARDAEFFDGRGRGSDEGDEADFTAVLIVGGSPQPRPVEGTSVRSPSSRVGDLHDAYRGPHDLPQWNRE